MKITFFSNFLNHHQLPISKEFINLGIDYTFVATEAIPEERIKLGYEDMNKKYPFVLTTYDSIENHEKALNLCEESDIVIIGDAPIEYLNKRMETNKITFKYSERLHKQGPLRVLDPRLYIKIRKDYYKYNDKNLFLLASSAYAYFDYSRYNVFKNKAYKWGYFPEVIEYDIKKLMKKKAENKINILWCGRLIKWKHPEYAVKLAKKLKKRNYIFEIQMVGTGPLDKKLQSYIDKYKLNDCIKLLGSVSNSNVRDYMERANIFLFTSDQNEGWGAVLNESLNSGCAVVAGSGIGAVPFLLNHEINGLVYKNKKFNDFYKCVIKLMDDKKLMESIGTQGYNTMINYWSPKNAVNNLLDLCDKMSTNDRNSMTTEKNVPCSKAKCMSEKKYCKSIFKREVV